MSKKKPTLRSIGSAVIRDVINATKEEAMNKLMTLKGDLHRELFERFPGDAGIWTFKVFLKADEVKRLMDGAKRDQYGFVRLPRFMIVDGKKRAVYTQQTSNDNLDPAAIFFKAWPLNDETRVGF